MKSQGMLISAFAFAVVIAVFAVINVETVEVNFLFVVTSTPLILVILVSTLLGGLTVGLFGMIRIYRLQRNVKTLEKQVKLFEGEADTGIVPVQKDEVIQSSGTALPDEIGQGEDHSSDGEEAARMTNDQKPPSGT